MAPFTHKYNKKQIQVKKNFAGNGLNTYYTINSNSPGQICILILMDEKQYENHAKDNFAKMGALDPEDLKQLMEIHLKKIEFFRLEMSLKGGRLR